MPDRQPPDEGTLPALHAALTLQIDAGADEAIGEQSVNRLTLSAPTAEKFRQDRSTPESGTDLDARRESRPRNPIRLESTDATVSTAQEIARAAQSLEALEAAVRAFNGCPLKNTAMNTVFSDGAPEGPVMLIGEAPGAEEDKEGKPFVGASGQLLDKMLAAIGLNRREHAYITNIVFWRPPGNREPSASETAVCRPFLERHIELKKPSILVFLGGPSAKTMLNRTEGITRLRGRWFDFCTPTMAEMEAAPIPAMPLFHPAYLLRSSLKKRDAWRDLLAIKDKLDAHETHAPIAREVARMEA
ncbi:MAG: uracil-DNA glycosylase [Rhodospirillaceae bacterium]|nr:uracil-DNA glycosylase [Rhodospirillaceae bacterium]